MCQLSLVNLGNPDLNRLYALMQMVENSRTFNKDGTGIFSGGRIFKTHLCASIITNLGKLFNEYIIDDNPVICHVRAATFYNNAKKVHEETAHPFKGDTFVIAHNGSLSFKDENKNKDKKYEGLIDTQVFLHRLEEVRKYNPDKTIYDILVETMNEFEGKFAFLIYDLLEENYYVARGNSADLHIAKANGGFIVNTKKDDLELILMRFKNAVESMGISFESQDVTEIEKESVFILNKETNELEKLGDIKENVKIVVVETVNNRGRPWVNNQYSEIRKPEFSTILNFAITYMESLKDLDELIYHITGKPMVSLSKEDIKDFVEDYLPFLVAEAKEVKPQADILRSLMSYVDWINIYNGKNTIQLQFPYMLNSIDDIKSRIAMQKALNDLKKEDKTSQTVLELMDKNSKAE